MEMDDENQEKSYADLTNVDLESQNDFKFKFEKFLLSGNSDIEEDNEDILMLSDDSRSDEENSNLDYSIQDLSNASKNFSLTSEDWSVINSSQHPELRKSIMLNRNAKYMTLQLFHKIKSLLVENQAKIKTLRKTLEKSESKESHIMHLGQLGAPYFKTKKYMFCNDINKDTLDRRNRGLLTIYQTLMPSSKWSKSECDNLTRGVQLTYNHNKQKVVLKDITTLKEKLDKEDEDSEKALQIMDKIKRLEGELRNLKAIGIKDIPPLSQDKFINWEHISTEFLMDKHNAQECSTFWHIYLHPDINKSNWTSEENKTTKFLAEKYNKQDWDRIAAELGTNRSGFSVFLYYSSALCDQLPKTRFTEEEDKKLVELVERKKIGSFIPWNVIKESFEDRTKFQLMHRYKYYLSNLEQYTQGFTDAEDILIILLVQRFGRNYIKFTQYLPTKSYMQIKSRYDNHLRFKRIKGSFTLEEDRQIWDHFSKRKHEIGSLTVKLSRNRLQIRHRYGILKEFFEKNPNKSLENVPRRYGKMTETFRRLEFLKYIVEQFKGCVDVPTLQEIEEKLGKKKQSKNDQDIDILLVNFFSTSFALKQTPLGITTLKISNATNKIYNILKSWRVNLTIPEEVTKNKTLDIFDCEILYSLRNKYHSDIHTPSIDDLLPPNMNSLIGLRGLLLNLQLFKRSSSQRTLTLNDNLPAIRNYHDPQIASELLYIFHKKDISTQCIIENERSLFLERFVSMFMWSALLSIESPSEKILKSEQTSNHSAQTINKKKDEVECKNKPMKRNLKETSNIPVTKKIKLSVQKQQSKPELHKSLQPQRFSSRLRSKTQISDINGIIESEQDLVAVGECESICVNDTDPELLNLGSSKYPDQVIEMTKSANVKIHGDSKIIQADLDGIEPHNVPTKLVKVDKSEIMKLLQSKKPIKIIKIQSIQKADGTITMANPSNMKINERVGNPIESLASGLDLVRNIKNRLKAKFSNIGQITNNGNSVATNSNKIIINSTNSPSRISESSAKSCEPSHRKDLNKLDTFLSNVEDEDSIIDLTENEVMKNEVEQLDQFIKQESTLGLTFL